MNPRELHDSLLEKGAEKARTQAYFSTKDRYRKQVRASLMVYYINQGETIGKSEQLALIHDDYVAACEEAEKAEQEAGIAAVAYEAAQSWFRAWQTLEASERARMTLR